MIQLATVTYEEDIDDLFKDSLGVTLFYLIKTPDEMCQSKFNITLEHYNNKTIALKWKNNMLDSISNCKDSMMKDKAVARINKLYSRMLR